MAQLLRMHQYLPRLDSIHSMHMQRHLVPLLLIGFATGISLLVGFVPGLQPPSWHNHPNAAHELQLPGLDWFATDAEAEPPAARPAEQ